MELVLCLLHCGGGGCGSSPFSLLPGPSRLGFPCLLQPRLLRFQRRQLRPSLGPLFSDLPSRGLDGVLLGGVHLGLSRRFGVGPFLRLLLCPLLGKRLFQRPHLGLLAGNGLLRQAGFLVGCRHLTLDLGSRCLMGGCGRESSHNGRHGRGVDGHAMRPLCSLLLGDADGALHGSVVLRGPLPGHPEGCRAPHRRAHRRAPLPFGRERRCCWSWPGRPASSRGGPTPRRRWGLTSSGAADEA